MKNLTDRDLILSVFYLVDEFVKSIDIDPKPGPQDKLHMSEILTLMLLHPILKPFKTLKTYHRWIEINFKDMFGKLPEYSRITRIFANNYEYLIVLMKKLSNQNGFGFVADGTCIGVMEAIRGKFAKCFRNARKVKSASKQQWYWGFILELVIDQEGKIAYFRVGTEAEVKQLEDILEDLADIRVLCDRGNRGEKMHARMWDEKQI